MNKVETNRIEKLARKFHEGQLRRDKVTPYFTHVERVVKRIEKMYWQLPDNEIELLKQISFFHDSEEDQRVTIQQLRELNVHQKVLDSLPFLNHNRDDDYLDYIKNLKRDSRAVKVKIADILDNLSDNPTEKQIVKYARALLILMGKEE